MKAFICWLIIWQMMYADESEGKMLKKVKCIKGIRVEATWDPNEIDLQLEAAPPWAEIICPPIDKSLYFPYIEEPSRFFELNELSENNGSPEKDRSSKHDKSHVSDKTPKPRSDKTPKPRSDKTPKPRSDKTPKPRSEKPPVSEEPLGSDGSTESTVHAQTKPKNNLSSSASTSESSTISNATSGSDGTSKTDTTPVPKLNKIQKEETSKSDVTELST